MSYHCFLCNDRHNDSPTEEHFIPKSIDGPQQQWLPVCAESNARSNTVFDNEARDLLYYVRFLHTRALKRTGDALLADGTVTPFKFAFFQSDDPPTDAAFRYIYDKATDAHIRSEQVYAIAFPVGMSVTERVTFSRGLAKISLAALIYLLKRDGVDDQTIQEFLSQTQVDALRHVALDLPWDGPAVSFRFRLGRSDVLSRLQDSCEHEDCRNHAITFHFQEDNSIQIEGMLYSQYGWLVNLANEIEIDNRELRLENAIPTMDVSTVLKDTSQSTDSVCIINPDFYGERPKLPGHWQN